MHDTRGWRRVFDECDWSLIWVLCDNPGSEERVVEVKLELCHLSMGQAINYSGYFIWWRCDHLVVTRTKNLKLVVTRTKNLTSTCDREGLVKMLCCLKRSLGPAC